MNTMYFTCSKLRSLLRVSACERNRADVNPASFKQTCRGCTHWQTETTDPKNLKTEEEVMVPVHEDLNKPLPKRFDTAGETSRMYGLDIGQYAYRDTNRKVHPA